MDRASQTSFGPVMRALASELGDRMLAALDPERASDSECAILKEEAKARQFQSGSWGLRL